MPIAGLAVDEIAIKVHFADGDIMSRHGSRTHIGICGIVRNKFGESNKDKSYLDGIPIDRPIGKSHRVEAPSHSRETQEVFYGFDASRFREV